SDYEAQLEALASQMGGLTEAVKDALKLATISRGFVTATQVRDHLLKAGFDFSRYSSNPLASVNTTLRRFKADEIETSETESGVTCYRWRRLEEHPLNKLRVFGRPNPKRSAIPPPPSFKDEK